MFIPCIYMLCNLHLDLAAFVIEAISAKGDPITAAELSCLNRLTSVLKASMI